MSSTDAVGARDLLRDASFLFFLLSRSLSRFSSQIADFRATTSDFVSKFAA